MRLEDSTKHFLFGDDKISRFRPDFCRFGWVVASRRRGRRERVGRHFQRHVDFARSGEG